MQKTGMTNFSSFLVWSDLEKGITYGCDHYGAVNNHLYCALGHLWHGDEQPNNQTTGSS